MTDYQNDKAAQKRAETLSPWIWAGIPAVIGFYMAYTYVVAPIVCALKAGCGVASW